MKYVTGNLLDAEAEVLVNILASTHFLISENPKLTEDQLFEKIGDWNVRKKSLITKGYIHIAVEHLHEYETQINFGINF